MYMYIQVAANQTPRLQAREPGHAAPACRGLKTVNQPDDHTLATWERHEDTAC